MEQQIENSTNSRCKTQLWDAVAEPWRNCAAAKSSTRSSAFSSSSWCPYKVDERKRGMAETSRHPKQSKEKEVTRRTMVLRWMFQKKRKGRKKSSRREKKVSSKPGQIRSCPRRHGLDHIVHNGRFRFLFSAKFRMMKFPTCFMKPINTYHRASSNYFQGKIQKKMHQRMPKPMKDPI